MLVNSANLEALFIAFNTSYQSAFQAAPTFVNQLATTIPVNTSILRLPWVGRLPVMREWIGPRQVHSAANKYLDIVPRTFESTQGLKRTVIEDDQYGIFSSMIVPQMGFQAAKWADYTLIDVIRANGTWSDGKAFFATDHPVNVDNSGLGTYSNLHTSTALTIDNYASTRALMMSRLGEDGKPLHVMPNLLLVPPQLEQTAKHILTADYIAPPTFGNQTGQVGQISNTLKGTAQVMVIPELSVDATTWYLLDTTKPIKPFVWALRDAPEFAMRTDPKDPHVFDKDEFLYGIRARGEAGFGFAWMADKCVA